MANAEHTVDQSNTSSVRRKHRHEGPKNHLLAFALSILLTGLAFVAVSYYIAEAEELHIEAWWIVFFIITLAIFQAVIQLAYWMHMKDKGHGIAIFGIASGFFVALTCVAAGLLWSWW